VISPTHKTNSQKTYFYFLPSIILFFSVLSCQTLLVPTQTTPADIISFAGSTYFPTFNEAPKDKFSVIFNDFVAKEGCQNLEDEWNKSLKTLNINVKNLNTHIMSIMTCMAVYSLSKCHSPQDIKKNSASAKEIVKELANGHPYFFQFNNNDEDSGIKIMLIGLQRSSWSTPVDKKFAKILGTHCLE
jgi:hypothetical protein